MNVFRTVSVSDAMSSLGSSVVDIVETSAAEDQESVDVLLATALKVNSGSSVRKSVLYII